MQLIRAAFSSLSPEKRVDRHRSPQVGDRLGYMDCIARPCMWLHNNCTYRSTNQGAHVCVAPYVMLDLHALNPTKRHCQATPPSLFPRTSKWLTGLPTQTLGMWNQCVAHYLFPCRRTDAASAIFARTFQRALSLPEA